MIVSGKKISVTNDISSNKEKTLAAITQAADVNADILLTPEGCLSGYTHQFDQKELVPALKEVLNAAKECRVGLALGTCYYEHDGKCYNQIRFYDRSSQYLGFHSKILKCGSLEDTPTGEITAFASSPLRIFDWGSKKVGGMICNDLWANPECTPMPDVHISQQLSNLGAKIIFHAVNGDRDQSAWSEVQRNYHEANLRMRARAGKLWIVTVDNSHPVSVPSAAPSGVLDPSGSWVCKAENTGEQFFSYEIQSQ